jgi:hypothetical protein
LHRLKSSALFVSFVFVDCSLMTGGGRRSSSLLCESESSKSTLMEKPAGCVMGKSGNRNGLMLLHAWTRGYLAFGRRPRGTRGIDNRCSIENFGGAAFDLLVCSPACALVCTHVHECTAPASTVSWRLTPARHSTPPRDDDDDVYAATPSYAIWRDDFETTPATSNRPGLRYMISSYACAQQCPLHK